VGGMLILLAATPEVPMDRLLFLTISAVSNVGLSHDPISSAGWMSWSTLSLLMLLGKIVPLMILWDMAEKVKNARIAVG
jgi:Trk-type K+ transport system membrane component